MQAEVKSDLPELAALLSASSASSFLLPSFYARLAAADRVLIAGCGGGFDFLHSMLIYPELIRMGLELCFFAILFFPELLFNEGKKSRFFRSRLAS